MEYLFGIASTVKHFLRLNAILSEVTTTCDFTFCQGVAASQRDLFQKSVFIETFAIGHSFPWKYKQRFT